MRAGMRIGFGGIALAAAVLALGGCGGSSGGASDQAPTLEAQGKAVHETATTRPPTQRTVIGRRLGPARVEPGEQVLPASPCEKFGKNGTTTIHIWPDAGHCARVEPGERLAFVNHTGIGPRHAGAVAIRVLIGDYELSIGPHGNGRIPAPVETYLGRGSHRVRIAGAPGWTILLLPPVCAIRPPAAPGEKLCFR